MTNESLGSSNGESRPCLLSAVSSRIPARLTGVDDGVVISVIDVRSRRVIESGSPDRSSGPARARPLRPRADAVATAVMTFQSLGRLSCCALVCTSYLLVGGRLPKDSNMGVRPV